MLTPNLFRVMVHKEWSSIAATHYHLSSRVWFCSHKPIIPSPPLALGSSTLCHATRQCPPEYEVLAPRHRNCMVILVSECMTQVDADMSQLGRLEGRV
jgi:hypothetical protein